MDVIVDLQGFWKPSNVFVLKEIAVLPLGTETPVVYQFAAPSPWRDLPLSYQRKNRWLERHYHGLRWSSGTLPYNTVKDVLTPLLKGASRVYVKGRDKIIWLRHLTDLDNPIEDLEKLHCPSLRKLQSTCEYHSENTTSAAENVKLLAKWLQR